MQNSSPSETNPIKKMKYIFERAYPEAHFVIQEMDKNLIVELPLFRKCYIAWHSQRPDHIFANTELLLDQYIDTYHINEVGEPEGIYALNGWLNHIKQAWEINNPFELSSTLLATKEYGIYFHLFAISRCFAIESYQARYVPKPLTTYRQAFEAEAINYISGLGVKALDFALNQAANLTLENGDIFIAENWLRSKESICAINQSVKRQLKDINKLALNANLSMRNALKIKGADVRKAVLYTTTGEKLSRKA